MEGDNAVIFNPAEQPPFFLYSLNKVLPCQDSNLKYLDPESSAIAITLQGNVINKNYAEKIRKMGKRSTDLPNECVKFNFQFFYLKRCKFICYKHKKKRYEFELWMDSFPFTESVFLLLVTLTLMVMLAQEPSF